MRAQHEMLFHLYRACIIMCLIIKQGMSHGWHQRSRRWLHKCPNWLTTESMNEAAKISWINGIQTLFTPTNDKRSCIVLKTTTLSISVIISSKQSNRQPKHITWMCMDCSSINFQKNWRSAMSRTSNERVQSESVDEDIVHILRTSEQLCNHVQVRSHLASFIQHVLYQF